jgi:tripartite-type tricarboxylate transporter receptor subunit TctC
MSLVSIGIRRLVASLLVVSFSAIASTAACAQAPGKGPIRILVGFAAGGTTDVAARLIADRLREDLDRPVVVENKAGAGGRIAAEALKGSPADGSTLLLVPMVVPVLAPLVSRQLGYDPAHDLAPVAHVAYYAIALAVAPNHPAGTMGELAAWAKANPARASFGTPAAGSLPHFFGVMAGKAIGVDMVHVPYKGVAPLAVDLAGNQLPVGISALSDLIELHRAGRLRIIATSGARRSALLPTVPTFIEQGFPAIEGNGWIAFYAPAGTPEPVIEQWSRAIAKVVTTPEVTAKLIQLGLEPTGSTPEELAAIMAVDTARWRPIIQASGFSGE